jgi:hypothetical protein
MKNIFFKKRYFFVVFYYDGKLHQICDRVHLIFYKSTRDLFLKWLTDTEQKLREEKKTKVVIINWYVL